MATLKKKSEEGVFSFQADDAIFGERFLHRLNRYGFGVVGKADLEAIIFEALIHSSPELKKADSFGRAELLRITDQRYRALSRRAGMWLADSNFKTRSDAEIITAFLKQALSAYADDPKATEVRILIDDEIERRNVQRALEREQGERKAIPLEIGLTGRFLILRQSDLDRLIKHVDKSRIEDPDLLTALSERKSADRRAAVLRCIKAGVPILGQLVQALPLGSDT